MSVSDFYSGSAPAGRRRLAVLAAAAAALLVAGVAWHYIFGPGPTGPAPRTVVAVDTTVKLDANDRAALLRRRVQHDYASSGRDVAVYAFGADAGEATEVLPFTHRAPCQGTGCSSLWQGDAEAIIRRAAAAAGPEATGSGVLEATCSLPTRPGDTVLLVSDLTERTSSLDLAAAGFGPGQVDGAVDRARRAGLICPQLRGVHLVVLGFGSDGRSGATALAIEKFWRQVAHEARVASLDIQRFGG